MEVVFGSTIRDASVVVAAPGFDVVEPPATTEGGGSLLEDRSTPAADFCKSSRRGVNFFRLPRFLTGPSAPDALSAPPGGPSSEGSISRAF